MKIFRMIYSNEIDEVIIIVRTLTYLKNCASLHQDDLNIEDLFYIRLEMMYHDYESHFRIQARFDRRLEDQDHIFEEYHRIYLNLSRIAFIDVLDQALINQVVNFSDLSVELQEDPLVQKWQAIGQFSIVEFDFGSLPPVNLHSPFSAKTSKAQSVLQKLRFVNNIKGTIKLYVHGGENDRKLFDKSKEDLFKESAPLGLCYHKNATCE